MILVFGTICIDRIRRIPRFPVPGGFVEVAEDLCVLGGEAANTANALRSWGADVVLAGNWLGSGEKGRLLRKMLAKHGLANSTDVPGQCETPVCDIFLTPDGERTMVGNGFSAADDHVDISGLPYKKGSWFTAEPNMSITARHAVQAASEAGMQIYLMDFYRNDECVPEGAICQSSTDWIGARGDLETNMKWASRWSKRHRCTTILTDAERAMVVAEASGTVQAIPVPQSELTRMREAEMQRDAVMDSTGAGDTFRAAMLFGLSQDWPFPQCIRFAASAGALSCLSLGATIRVPKLPDIESLASSDSW